MALIKYLWIFPVEVFLHFASQLIAFAFHIVETPASLNCLHSRIFQFWLFKWDFSNNFYSLLFTSARNSNTIRQQSRLTVRKLKMRIKIRKKQITFFFDSSWRSWGRDSWVMFLGGDHRWLFTEQRRQQNHFTPLSIGAVFFNTVLVCSLSLFNFSSFAFAFINEISILKKNSFFFFLLPCLELLYRRK